MDLPLNIYKYIYLQSRCKQVSKILIGNIPILIQLLLLLIIILLFNYYYFGSNTFG